MLKNILNLEGAKQLTSDAQKKINGGLRLYKSCQDPMAVCPAGTECVGVDTSGRLICE